MLEFWYKGQFKKLNYRQVVFKLYVMMFPHISKDSFVIHVCMCALSSLPFIIH